MKSIVIAGNWKMNTTPSEGLKLLNEIIAGLQGIDFPAQLSILAFPPFTHLPTLVAAAVGSSLRIGAQNMHQEDTGAYTGEISAMMLKEIGIGHVLIGHSERRQYFNETNESCNVKISKAISQGLVPIYCIGETLTEREAGKHFDIVKAQLEEGLSGIEINNTSQIIIAYEPVWAIGTGKTASPEQASEMHTFIRTWLNEKFDSSIANDIAILYGGSMNAANADGLLAMSNIDGGLVGGASLKPADFISIIQAGVGQIRLRS